MVRISNRTEQLCQLPLTMSFAYLLLRGASLREESGQKGFHHSGSGHADALARGDLSGSGDFNSFVGRIEDLAISRSYAKSTHANVPVIVMEHSFGSLRSQLAVGTLTPAGPQTDPALKGPITFTSPGIVKGVLSPDSFKNVATPVLTIIGDKDVVKGFATNWRIQRAVYDSSNRPSSALVIVQDGDHNLTTDANDDIFADLVNFTAAFIQANALGDTKA